MRPHPHAETLDAAAITDSSASHAVLGERYELLALLGSGGMGNVYKALDRELDEIVALKVLRREIAVDAPAIERFRMEVKLARRVTHPNVARVFDIGEIGGEKLITMELVKGEALSALLAREAPLPFARVLTIGSSICAGVGAAHTAGVVHRDLKPDNVLVEVGGRIVVSDFGIARALASHARISGGVVGTPAYMAPEQVEGTIVDARADIYAFGAMFYEMLVGAMPFEGESAYSVAAARLFKPAPDPRVRRPDIPDRIAELTLKCMARKPEDRPATMADVGAALEALARAGTDSSTPRMRAPSVRPPRGEPSRDVRHVAVLPFRNHGGVDDDVADELTDDLIDLLSMAKGVRVRARSLVQKFRQADRDVCEIGKGLTVHVVVDGSVRKTPGSLRIAARLVSVDDGIQLWGKRFEGPEAEALVLNDQVARAVADAITGELQASPREASESPEAVDLYLRARHALRTFFSGGMRRAVPLFERAVAFAPDDPHILAGFAMALARRPKPGIDARAMAERALRIAPSLPDAHIADGLVRLMANDGVGAIGPLRRAIKLWPNSAEAHNLLGGILIMAGAHEEGEPELERAMDLDPLAEEPRVALSTSLSMRGDSERAAKLVHDLPVVLARIAVWKNDGQAARALVPRVASLPPIHRPAQGWVAMIIDGTPPYGAFLPPFVVEASPAWLQSFYGQFIAEAAGHLRDIDRGIDAIERIAHVGSFDVAWVDLCPTIAPLREDPRFKVARERISANAERIRETYANADSSSV